MSKAEQWKERLLDLQADLRGADVAVSKHVKERPRWNHYPLSCDVDDMGYMVVEHKDERITSVHPNDALALGEWLVATFGSSPERVLG